jgi:hypothetical protein
MSNVRLYYTLYNDKLVKSYIDLDNLVGFGYFHEKEFTTKGTFKKFTKYGYIKTLYKKYMVTRYDVAELMQEFKGKYEIKRKKPIKERRNGKEVTAINWDYTVKKSE